MKTNDQHECNSGSSRSGEKGGGAGVFFSTHRVEVYVHAQQYAQVRCLHQAFLQEE